VFDAHALAGTSLALLLVFKLRRVLPRVGTRLRRDRRTRRGVVVGGPRSTANIVIFSPVSRPASRRRRTSRHAAARASIRRRQQRADAAP